MFRSVVVLCCLARFAPAQDTICRHLEGDRIVAKDLAIALPTFDRIPPDTLLANAPMAGSRRVFHAPEIMELARRYSLDLTSVPEICFDWAMQPLDHDRVADAMAAALLIPGARIEIAEMTTSLVPPGRIEFTTQHLGVPASPDQRTPVLWRGDVVYAGGHRRFAVWARVWIHAPCTKVSAVEDLNPGIPIESRQIHVESAECFPSPTQVANPDQFIGMIPLRHLSAGAELRSNLVKRANDVNRGDLVQVEVRSGNTRLAFTGRAESAGRSGETISIRNPDSKLVFRARVSGRNKAVVQTGTSKVD